MFLIDNTYFLSYKSHPQNIYHLLTLFIKKKPECNGNHIINFLFGLSNGFIYWKQVRQGLIRLSQRLLGPNSIVQSALPDILTGTPQHFFDETLQYVEENARNFYSKLNKIPGLKPVEPQGAMYMMV
jgi:hypothetical protein